ncbi:YSIRK-type signal peptide-containing protein [Staphylococcus kloosii]|uniref:YSIRK-type signal peptide-containing protein n=1 Tax=Staphylococcus kloosii TaxID=29384 RepID=UPI0018A0B49C|nr:YSIRK-type signal peptide-containing protein [Staphylococcus kloosii]MBF7024628.1 YSIRK-type signal peptide-containing protein [Staphylococcus kloosii]
MRSYKAHISTRKNRYAIRKFSIGIASILVGSALFYGASQEAQASEQVGQSNNVSNNLSDVVQNSSESDVANGTGVAAVNEVNDNARNQSSNSNNENPQDNQLQPVSQVNENNDSSVSSQSDAQQSQPANGPVNTLGQSQTNNKPQASNNSNSANQPVADTTYNDLGLDVNDTLEQTAQQNANQSVSVDKPKIYPVQVVRKSVNPQTKEVDILKIVESNSKYLSDEERKYFLRMVSRNSSFQPRDWDHIYRKDYNVIANNVNSRVINASKVGINNKIINAMYDLIENRNNDSYYRELAGENSVNYYKIDKNIQREQDQQIVKVPISKSTKKISEYRGGRWVPWNQRYEQWGLRTNESLNNKIEEVFVKYRWKGQNFKDVITRNDKGFYWFKEDEKFSVGKSNIGGGVDFFIKFKKNAVLDKAKDLLWGYIISDTKENRTLLGSNIGFKKLNLGEGNLDKQFNNFALNKFKEKITTKLNDPNSVFATSTGNKSHYLNLLNKATENVTSSVDYQRAILALNNLETRLLSADNEVKPTTVTRQQVSTDTNVVDVFKYINANEQHLSDEERRLFLRTATRYTSLTASDWDKVYSKNYDTLSSNANTRKLDAGQVANINKTLNALYDLIQNRNNDNFYKELTNDSNTGRLHNNFSVKNNIQQIDGRQALEFAFSKNTLQTSQNINGRWKPLNIRYEQWGLRTNESLNNKIEQVIVKYRWNGQDQEEILTRNDKGFYWFKEDEKFAINKANVGGNLNYLLKFKKGTALDRAKDVAWGYIISDSKNLSTVTGANIGFKKLTFDTVEQNFNQQAITNLKQQLVDHINNQSSKLTSQANNIQAYIDQVNAITASTTTPLSVDEVKAQLKTVFQQVAQAVEVNEQQNNIIKVPSNNQHLRLFAKSNNDVNFHSFQSKGTNPANSINADGSLTIQPKGYFFYNLKAVDKLAPGKRINIKVLADKVDENTKFEYSVQRKDNTYIVVVSDITKSKEGYYELKNFVVPKDAERISLRLDNRTGTTSAQIKSFSVTSANSTTNDLFVKNLIVTPTNQQHIGKYAKKNNDKYFSSFQSLKTGPVNSINPDGSLTIQPKGYFFYNLKAVDKLAPGQTFNIQVDATQADANTKVEYAIYDAQNNLLVKITDIPKNEDGTYKLENIVVPDNASRIAVRVDNRKGTSNAQLSGIYVVPVNRV